MKPPDDRQDQDLISWIIPVAFFAAFAILHFVCTIPNFLPRLFESVVSTKAVVVVMGAWMFALILFLCHGVRGFHLVSRSSLFAPLAALMGASWVSSIMGDHAHLGPYELAQDLAWGLWILMAFHLWRVRDSWVWVGGLVMGTLMLTLTCNVAHVGGQALGVMRSGGDIISWGALKQMLLLAGFDYPFYNCNFNAAFLMAPVVGVLLAWRFRVSRDSLWGVAAVFSLVAILVGMLLSKASMLVLFLGGLALAGGPKLLRGIPRERHRFFFALFTLTGLIFISVLLSRLSKDEDFMLDSSSGARMEMWQGVVALVSPEGPRMKPTRLSPCTGPRWSENTDKLRRFLLGWGPGAYPAVSATARPTSYYAGSYTSDYSEHPHSSVMSFLFDGGVLGLAMALWFFLRLFLLQVRLSRIPGEQGAMARVLLGVALCMAAYSLVSVEGHYSEVRVWWAVVIGGTMALEMAHRRLEPRAPREFALGFTLVFMAVVFGVLGRFILVVGPRTLALADLKSSYGALLDPEELERAISRAERGCLMPEGRVFTTMNTIVGLKDAALLRDYEVGRVQALMIDKDPKLSGRWAYASLRNLHEAVKMAPDFSDIARLYGEMLWKYAQEAGRIGSRLVVDGRELDPEVAKTLAESWIHRATIKGDQDALIFDTFRLNPKLLEAMGQRVFDHPIFNDTFRRRAAHKGIRLPLRLNFAHFLLTKIHQPGAVNEALAVMPSLLRDLPQEQAWSICQGLGEAIVALKVDPILWKVVERGGPSSPDQRKAIFSQPERKNMFLGVMLEALRDKLFKGETSNSWQDYVPLEIRHRPLFIQFGKLLEKGPPR